jgi:2-keto-4-pentenoate hydratase
VQALDATDAESASLEICDARIRDWKCPYPDFFADNGFSARIALSGRWVPVREVDLLDETVVLLKRRRCRQASSRDRAEVSPTRSARSISR